VVFTNLREQGADGAFGRKQERFQARLAEGRLARRAFGERHGGVLEKFEKGD
jgi:hypothetical protein